MLDLLLQFLGLFLLIGGLWLGYGLWVKPHQARLALARRPADQPPDWGDATGDCGRGS